MLGAAYIIGAKLLRTPRLPPPGKRASFRILSMLRNADLIREVIYARFHEKSWQIYDSLYMFSAQKDRC